MGVFGVAACEGSSSATTDRSSESGGHKAAKHGGEEKSGEHDGHKSGEHEGHKQGKGHAKKHDKEAGGHKKEGEHKKKGHEGHGGGGHGGHGPQQVEIPAESLEDYGVTVEKVQMGRLAEMVEATAKVKNDVERVAHISPFVKGQITKLYVSLGDRVEAGQTVARMQSVELGKARAAVQQAQAKLEVAESNFERQKKLKDKGIASERAFIEARGELKTARAELEAARAELQTYGVSGGSGPYYPLRSKIKGTVIEQHAAVGETKSSNDSLFVVADQSVAWVIGQVAEKDIHKVEKGMDAVVTMDAYPDRSWTGTVDWVADTVDEETRVLPVRIVLDNPERTLKPGMFGTVQLKPSNIPDPVPMVPVDAVQKVHGKDAVFVPGDKKGVFKPKQVEVGAESGGLVEITSGLSAGDEIVTAGAFDLKAALTAKGRSAAHSH
ncbi:MAG: efflux RND transporter periplasmic adaptor subunit [Bradymonadaceae bacterium]